VPGNANEAVEARQAVSAPCFAIPERRRMNRSQFATSAAGLVLASCSYPSTGNSLQPFLTPAIRRRGYRDWQIHNFMLQFEPGERKFGRPPWVNIYDENLPYEQSLVGGFTPVTQAVLQFNFQDPDYLDGDMVTHNFMDPLHGDKKRWTEHRIEKWFREFVWEITGKDYPGGPGGILHKYGKPILGLNFVDGSLVRTLYPSGEQDDLGVKWPWKGKGPDSISKACGLAIGAYWLACAGVIVAALNLLETRGSPAAQAQAAQAAAALLLAWWGEVVTCHF
jgi:hypothetical protein